jgi:RNA polymerase sigma factor (sigma-70 family)
MIEDAELLRRFTHDRSESAFAELVRRHLDLVYGFALRRVGGDAHSADDVTQRVFLDLAGKTASLQTRTHLAGWLYTSTRFAAADLVRSAQRRRHHEEQAHAMHTLHDAPLLDWEKLRPVLDEVMDQLGEPDREALLLRFFEDRPLADVGAKLAVSPDAARMRIDRALDKLRGLLSRRGLTSTSATLATILAGQPIVAAPASLGAAISASFTSTTIIGAGGNALAMTTLQKSLAAALSLGLAAGLYVATAYHRQNSTLTALTRRESDLAAQLTRTRAQEVAVATRLKSVETEIDAYLAPPAAGVSGDGALEAQIAAWYANLDHLKRILVERPEASIPELALLPADAWFDIASQSDLSTDSGLRRALAELRIQAAALFAAKLGPAFHAFVQENQGSFPDQISQLLPYLKGSVEPAWLDRYTLVNSTLVSPLPAGVHPNEFIAMKTLTDSAYDKNLLIGTIGVFSFDDADTGSNGSKVSPHTSLVGVSLSSDPARSLSRSLRQFYRDQKANAAP